MDLLYLCLLLRDNADNNNNHFANGFVIFAGWFRQCDLIPYSRDVDIGIWITDYNDQLISSMQNNGLQLIHRFGKVRFKDN